MYVDDIIGVSHLDYVDDDMRVADVGLLGPAALATEK